MKHFWKKHRIHIILSLLASMLILAADICSRPYFAVGGGGMVPVMAVTYWIVTYRETKER